MWKKTSIKEEGYSSPLEGPYIEILPYPLQKITLVL